MSIPQLYRQLQAQLSQWIVPIQRQLACLLTTITLDRSATLTVSSEP